MKSAFTCRGASAANRCPSVFRSVALPPHAFRRDTGQSHPVTLTSSAMRQRVDRQKNDDEKN